MDSERQNKKVLREALDALPHGSEFCFVDRLLSLVPGEEATAEYRLQADAHFLKGHFPGCPLMPGVLMIEAAAQVAGIALQTDPKEGRLKGLKLAGIRNAKILGTASPGQVLSIVSRVTGRMGHLAQATAEIRIGDRVVLKADLTMSGERLEVS